MNDIGDEYQKLVEELGHPVHMHTPLCDSWKEEHGKCFGCESELGCSLISHLMLIAMIPMSYSPKSFEDHQRMSQRMQELQKLALAAKTADELRKVPTV